MTMIEGAKPVSELVERLTKRALDVECAVVEFRDIGGRNALDKADALLAEFRLLREAADALERAERERDEAREARDACAQALFDVSDNVHHCGEQYMTNPPMCVRAHNARMALQRITQKHVLSQTQGEEESST